VATLKVCEVTEHQQHSTREALRRCLKSRGNQNLPGTAIQEPTDELTTKPSNPETMSISNIDAPPGESTQHVP
jgi:hypothetical protein